MIKISVISQYIYCNLRCRRRNQTGRIEEHRHRHGARVSGSGRGRAEICGGHVDQNRLSPGRTLSSEKHELEPTVSSIIRERLANRNENSERFLKCVYMYRF